MRISTLQWAAAVFSLFIGEMMLTVPHRFWGPAYTAVLPDLALWGLGFVAAGSGLLAVAVLAPRRGLVVAAHLAAAAVLLGLARGLAIAGVWTGAADYIVLAVGTALAPLFVNPAADASVASRHVFAALMGLGAALGGVAILMFPDQFGASVYDQVRPYLPWYGAALLASGIVLAYGHVTVAAPRPVMRGADWLAASVFVAMLVASAIPSRSWTEMAYYGGFGGLLALLPWLDQVLRRLGATPLRVRLAMALPLTVATSMIAPVVLVGNWAEPAATAPLINGLLLVVAATAGALAATALTKPLEALARDARRLGEGGAAASLPRSHIAELVDLAAAFGEMRNRLADGRKEQERAYAALQASEQRIRLILEKSSLVFVAMDVDGVITGWNAQAEAMFGWSSQEAIGRPFAEVVLPLRYQESLIRGLTRFLALGESPVLNKRIEVRAVHRDGHEFPVELTISPLRMGDADAFNVFILDITERKRVEEAHARYAHELERSNAELRQFAYVASHDLREPLRMVTSYVQLLAKRYKGRLDVEANEFIAFAVDGAMRMQELISDLLEYSRVRSTGEEFKPTDAGAILDQTLANLRLAVQESGAVVTHDPLPTVMADARQLGQLLQNLIGNAIKFHKPDEQPAVHISARENGHEWIFSVRDNGIGIAPEDRERIFEIFQRLHSRTEYPGTGIGLAICKQIVERHGGRVWVESHPERGSTFYFTVAHGEDDNFTVAHGEDDNGT